MKKKFVIPGRLDGLNEYTNSNRRNPYAGANMKKKNEAVIMSAIFSAGLKGLNLTDPVTLKIHWVEPNTRRDKDNICMAKKFILDSLVKMGVLPDDGWKNVSGFSDTFDVDKDNPRVEVTIEV